MEHQSHLDFFEVFPWNTNFETGNEEIDEQHKELVYLLNKLANTLTHDDSIEVNEAFAELAKYADYHFETEEDIWAHYFKDDNWFTSHQLSHASFLPKVLELKNKDADQPMQEMIEDIVKFLIRWLAFHIIDEDKRLSFVIDELKNGKSMEEAKLVSDRKMNGSIRVLIDTVLAMYDGLSSRTINLMRERNARIKAENKLREANKKLEELSITDQLTGLHNRRHFESVFENEIKRARRENHTLSLVLFDIDYFKKINDNYGHAYGDAALKKVGETLINVCKRPSDFVFRVGGEEFVVVTSSENICDGKNLAELIQRNINNLKIENSGSKISNFMTISAGIAEKIPRKNDTIDTYMKIADERLYSAKNGGRNMIVWK